jgi:hypothetical protein
MVDKGIGVFFGKHTLKDFTYVLSVSLEDKKRLELSKRISMAGGVKVI